MHRPHFHLRSTGIDHPLTKFLQTAVKLELADGVSADMESSEEKRRSKRARTLLKGRIVFNNRNSVLECTIRDISDTGARVAFAHPVDLPPEFELDIPKKGSAILAKVMWSYGNEFGVLFIGQTGAQRAASLPAVKDTLDHIDLEIDGILNETRRQLAELIGVPAEAVKLELHIETSKIS